MAIPGGQLETKCQLCKGTGKAPPVPMTVATEDVGPYAKSSKEMDTDPTLKVPCPMCRGSGVANRGGDCG